MKYSSKALEDYLLNNSYKTNIGISIADEFYKFIKIRYPFSREWNMSDDLYGLFLLIHIPTLRDFKWIDCDAEVLVNEFCAFLNSLKEDGLLNIPSYDFFSEVTVRLNHVLNVYREFYRFLKYPILNVTPRLISFENFKASREKHEMRKYNAEECGNYIAIDFFSNSSVILKNQRTGRYLKITVDEPLQSAIWLGDILYLRLKQRMFKSWEVFELKRCFYIKDFFDCFK